MLAVNLEQWGASSNLKCSAAAFEAWRPLGALDACKLWGLLRLWKATPKLELAIKLGQYEKKTERALIGRMALRIYGTKLDLGMRHHLLNLRADLF